MFFMEKQIMTRTLLHSFLMLIILGSMNFAYGYEIESSLKSESKEEVFRSQNGTTTNTKTPCKDGNGNPIICPYR